MDSEILIPIRLVSTSYVNAVVIVCTVLLGLSYIAVALRLWTRVMIINSVGVDDITIVPALMFFTGYGIILSLIAKAVSDKTSLSSDTMTLATNMFMALESCYIATIAVLKISLGFFFLRVIFNPRLKMLVKCILVLFSIYSTGYFLFAIFQCGVPKGSRYWRRKLSNQCVSNSVGLGTGYTFAALTAGTDLIFLSLTIPILRMAKLQMQEKLNVSILLFMGTIGCVASCLRIIWVPVLVSTSTDFCYKALLLGLCSGIESGLGIAASSFATIHPLIHHLAPSSKKSFGKSALSNSSRSNDSPSNSSNGKDVEKGAAPEPDPQVQPLRNKSAQRTDPRRSMLQQPSKWQDQQQQLRASITNPTLHPHLPQKQRQQSSQRSSGVNWYQPHPPPQQSSQRSSTISWYQPRPQPTTSQRSSATISWYYPQQQQSSKHNSTVSVRLPRNAASPPVGPTPPPRHHGHAHSHARNSRLPGIDGTISSSSMSPMGTTGAPTPEPGGDDDGGGSAPVMETINWAYGERLSWAERMEQAEAAQKQARARRRMKKRIRSPKKKQQDGLPLGIFAMAPPSPPPTNEGGDRKGKARDDADNRSSWSGWRRRSSLSARRMYRSGASKSEQRSQDNS